MRSAIIALGSFGEDEFRMGVLRWLGSLLFLTAVLLKVNVVQKSGGRSPPPTLFHFIFSPLIKNDKAATTDIMNPTTPNPKEKGNYLNNVPETDAETP